MEERLEEKHPESLRIFLIVDRAVSVHCRTNKKAVSGLWRTLVRLMMGQGQETLQLGAFTLPRRRKCCTYVFQKMWHPLAKCDVWDASKDVKLILSKSEKNHLDLSVVFRTWGSAIASICQWEQASEHTTQLSVGDLRDC